MKRIILSCKVLISISLLYFILSKVDLSAAKIFLSSYAGMKALFIVTCLMLLQTVLAGIRLRAITRVYGYNTNLLKNINVCFLGGFFSQAMISFIGGDAMRILSLSKSNITMRNAFSIVLLDRVLGFLALVFIIILVMPSMISIMDPSIVYNFLIIIAGIVLVTAMLFAACQIKAFRILEKFKIFELMFEVISNIKKMLFSKDAPIILVCSIGIHFVCVLAVFIAANLYDVNINLYWCLVIVMPALLISMLPISIAGWGVRESALMIGFSMLGLPAAKGVAISVILGLSLIIASLPGIVVFFLEKRSIQKTKLAST